MSKHHGAQYHAAVSTLGWFILTSSHYSQKEAKIARFPGENRSKANEINELIHRLKVLGDQCKTYVKDEAMAEAENSKSVEVTT